MSPRSRAVMRAQKVASADRFPTGAKRLDILLEGGLRRGDTAIIHGPAFLGKGVLAASAIRKAVADGIPAVVVTTRLESERLLEGLAIPDAQRGLVQVIDSIGASIGCDTDGDGIQLVDGPTDLNGIAAALNTAQAALQGHHDDHLLVIDSVSTLIAHNAANNVFRFLQVVLGTGRRAGAHAVLVLDEPMHDPKDVESLKHLSTGTIQVRDREGKQQVRILGFDLEAHLGWIDYRSDNGQFDVVGSFAAGRIR